MTAPASPLLVLRNPSEQSADHPWDRPVLNFGYKHFDRETRGLRVLGMWFRKPTTADDFDPCLVLLRPNVPVAIQTPCVVRMSQAYMFSPTQYRDEDHDAWVTREATVWAVICDFCRYLGLDPMRNDDLFKVRLVIEDHIVDLLRIPPAPRKQMTRIVDGEVKMTFRDTGKTIEQEVSHRG